MPTTVAMIRKIGTNRREYMPIRSQGDSSFPNSVMAGLVGSRILTRGHYYRKVNRRAWNQKTISQIYIQVLRARCKRGYGDNACNNRCRFLREKCEPFDNAHFAARRLRNEKGNCGRGAFMSGWLA